MMGIEWTHPSHHYGTNEGKWSVSCLLLIDAKYFKEALLVTAMRSAVETEVPLLFFSFVFLPASLLPCLALPLVQ